MSNFDDKNFIPKLICKMYYQNLTDKMFIIFGNEETEVSEFFELLPYKRKEPTSTTDAGSPYKIITTVNHSVLAHVCLMASQGWSSVAGHLLPHLCSNHMW